MSGRRGGTVLLWAAIVLLVAVLDSEAQIHAPARPAPDYSNSVSAGLSYGVQNDRDADFWGWSAGYSRALRGRWFAEASLTWDSETERTDNRPDEVIKTFTAVGTITYAVTKWLSLTSGLGKGFASTDNPRKTMQFESGDLGTGIAVGFATPGLPQFVRDSIGFSIAYEYNITQKGTSVSFDVSYGLSF